MDAPFAIAGDLGKAANYSVGAARPFLPEWGYDAFDIDHRYRANKRQLME
jgi:hypothetical protein